MELLDIKLDSLTRVQWATKELKDEWEPKFQKASTIYNKLEYDTVIHDVRKCMIAHHVDPHEMEKFTYEMAQNGLMVVPLAKQGVSGNGFSHVSSNFNGNGNFVYRSVVTKKPEYAYEFAQAHLTGDDIKIGELLGFPKCCSEFFDKVWKAGYVDPIWQQAENTSEENIVNSYDNNIKKLIKIDNSAPYISSVFRYIGIRFISHFSCSMNCKHSVEVANKWIQLAKDLNYEGVEDALKILSMPYEWSCLKGIAEINTPILKIVTDSVACYPNYIVQKEGDFYPENSPNAVQFPWKLKQKRSEK